MASATARRGELGSNKHDATQSPLRTPHHTNARASTPRPSISPLSTASKAHLSSPDTEQIGSVAQVTEREHGEQGAVDEDANEADQDDRSSSLSEPDEDQDDEYLQRDLASRMQNNNQGGVQPSSEVDSEAETERLDETPKKSRKQIRSYEKTPSKLSQAIEADDDRSEPPSPLQRDVGAASSTSTIETTGGQKRKRSETVESSLTSADSDLGESPRKRSHESPAELDDDDDAGVATTANDTLGVMSAESIDDEEHGNDTMSGVPTRGSKSRKNISKGRKTKDAAEETSSTSAKGSTDAEEDVNTEIAEKSDGELQHKNEASYLFEELARQFTTFREKLYNEKLESMNAELEMLSQPNCVHPEYLRQVAVIDARLEKQTRETRAFYKYRRQCIRQRTLGERSQLMSQYFQQVRDTRERISDSLGEDWYNIQKERRQAHQDKDEAYVYKFPGRRSAQVQQQAKYNLEVSVLSGVAKYVGFPAAPDINGACGEVVDDDLKAMKLTKKVQQTGSHHPTKFMSRPANSTVRTANERLVHDQFIEQNAWARPQGTTSTAHPTPGLTHTPDWAELPGQQGSSSWNASRQLSGYAPQSSPLATPVLQKRNGIDSIPSQGLASNNDHSESPTLMRDGPVHPKIPPLRNGDGGHHASSLHVAKQRQSATEPTGFRNISNISGASTIDAPSDSEKNHASGTGRSAQTPADVSGHEQGFSAVGLGASREGGNTFPSASFRSQEGAFGTPAPLPATST